MAISYEPLWNTLDRLNINKTEMRKQTGIATATMAKLAKNESLTLAMIDKICTGLNCRIEDVVQIVPSSSASFDISQIDTNQIVHFISRMTHITYGVVLEIMKDEVERTFCFVAPIVLQRPKFTKYNPTVMVQLSDYDFDGKIIQPWVYPIDKLLVSVNDITHIISQLTIDDLEAISAIRSKFD